MKRVLLSLIILSLAIAGPALAQSKAPASVAPRTPVGKPDLQGIWEARNTAAASLEDHGATAGIRAGRSVIVDPADGKIPYQPAALAQRDENFKNRAKADPLGKCYLPGVPRVTYLPYPFEIFQTPKYIVFASEFAHASRTVYLNGTNHYDGVDFWMGDSRGHWEGETLVVDVGNFNEKTWLDMSGNFHSDALRVVERYRRTSANTLQYEATLTDPKVYTKPWKISMPLYRHQEPDAQLFEYECHVYLEESSASGAK